MNVTLSEDRFMGAEVGITTILHQDLDERKAESPTSPTATSLPQTQIHLIPIGVRVWPDSAMAANAATVLHAPV